jgi:hypothetical protein
MDPGKASPPPLPFAELMESEAEPYLIPEIEKLLLLKQEKTESEEIPRNEVLNHYIGNESR